MAESSTDQVIELCTGDGDVRRCSSLLLQCSLLGRIALNADAPIGDAQRVAWLKECRVLLDKAGVLVDQVIKATEA